MPDAAANPCPNLPALPPAAALETRAALKHRPAVHAALAELRLRVQRLSTPAIVAARTRPSRRRAGSPSAGSATVALAAWERSLKRPLDLDPLVRMAGKHHHSLALTFGWASGPTARIVNLLALLQDGLIDAPSLDLGRYPRRSAGAYDRLPAGVTTCGEWQPWLLYMLRARERAAAWSSETIRAIRALLDATAAQVRAGARKHFSPELMELIFLEPYRRIGELVARPAFAPDPHLVARVAPRPQAKAQAA
jgi:hypothetical protein